MAIYLGDSKKLTIYFNGVVHSLEIYTKTAAADIIRLLSSDDFVLQDSRGIYLIAKEDN
jgi:hypothetical protein